MTRYRIIVGDRNTVRGVVELEAASYGITEQGVLALHAEDHGVIVTYAPGAWRSITDVERFKAAFGTEPTRDTIAKALACYERTVLSGNSLHDRAMALVQQRSPGKNAEPLARDYTAAL